MSPLPMTRAFQVAAPPHVIFGKGSAKKLGSHPALKRAEKILVVTDRGIEAAGLLAPVKESLGARMVLVDLDVVPDADVRHIDALGEKARALGVDAIVAVGGGSVMDTAKCTAAVQKKGQSITELEGIATIRAKLVPVVCVPTTAGTGAEATQFAVVKDPVAGKKRIYVDQSLTPQGAVLDPVLTVGMPRALTAATAVDAVTHAVEALASTMANPVATALALEAVELLIGGRALERALASPEDLEARGACLIAAHLAGQAISSAMLGACHAFAHALGAKHGTPHGTANGVFLLAVMRHNAEAARLPYARLGKTLGCHHDDDGARVRFALEAVERFVHDTAQIPRSLAALGVARPDVVALVALALQDADMTTNPAPMDEPSARALVSSLVGG